MRPPGRPGRRGRPRGVEAGVTGEEGGVAEGVRLQSGVTGHTGGGEGLAVVGAGLGVAAGVVGEPADGDGQLTGSRRAGRRRPPGRNCPRPAGGTRRRGSDRPGGRARRLPCRSSCSRISRTASCTARTWDLPTLCTGSAAAGGPSTRVVAMAAGPPVMNARRSTSLSSSVSGSRGLTAIVSGGAVVPAARAAADGLAGLEAQVGEAEAGEHVPEDPFVRVVGTSDLPDSTRPM